MATQFPSLSDAHIAFIAKQHIFFVGTAAQDGRVNVSPKGADSLRVLTPNRIVWRNLSGSGNETDGHLRRINRMTLMWCSFDATPLILRAYGSARMIARDDPDWDTLNGHFPANPGARQIFEMTIEMAQKSCGWAVPLMDHKSDRDVLDTWAAAKGDDGVRATWTRDNQYTIDGFPTEFTE